MSEEAKRIRRGDLVVVVGLLIMFTAGLGAKVLSNTNRLDGVVEANTRAIEISCNQANSARRAVNRATEGLRSVFQTLLAPIPDRDQLAPEDMAEFDSIIAAEAALEHLAPLNCSREEP